MKGVILASGLGTRLYPLTHATNKHLLPIYDKPMIFYPIQTLVRAGIDEILVITGGPHSGDFFAVLKNGTELGVKKLHYAYQEKADGGIGDALKLARSFADGGSITVILGDNIADTDISEAVETFGSGALVFLKQVVNARDFGVAEFDPCHPEKIVAIHEKPERPVSEMAVTGLYIYDNQVFDFLEQLQPSWRNQLEITDINNLYIKEQKLHWRELQGFWSDAGTIERLFLASSYWAQKAGNLTEVHR